MKQKKPRGLRTRATSCMTLPYALGAARRVDVVESHEVGDEAEGGGLEVEVRRVHLHAS